MHSHQITEATRGIVFVLAGNARFTLVSKKTGTRFTYRVKASEDGNVRFVSLMNGPDNEKSFSFFGTIFKDGSFRTSAKSKISRDAASVKAFEWFYTGHLSKARIPDTIEMWHEGRCGRCARVLTVPESIETGYGPECASVMGLFAKPGSMTAPVDEDPESVAFALEIREQEANEERRRTDYKFNRESAMTELSPLQQEMKHVGELQANAPAFSIGGLTRRQAD